MREGGGGWEKCKTERGAVSGEGVPDYAALYMNRSIKPRKFPEPFPSLFPYRVDPTTGYREYFKIYISRVAISLCSYPYRSECNRHSFFTYYFSDAEGKSWCAPLLNITLCC